MFFWEFGASVGLGAMLSGCLENLQDKTEPVEEIKDLRSLTLWAPVQLHHSLSLVSC